MNSTARSCFICGSSTNRQVSPDYSKCDFCGHERLVTSPTETMIINDRLDVCEPAVLNSLDRFKNRIVRRCLRTKEFLLDIGSASGRFLYQNRREFRRVTGVEVTPECVEFARGLGLEIVTELDSLDGSPSVVTYWHSLEHIPVETIGNMLAWIREHSTSETVIIVSVPNADSLQATLLREHFAFYDVPNHLHQFSLTSLDLLMGASGFERVSMFQSYAYAGFGWLQGLLNIFNSYHNYFYYRRKRGWDFALTPSARYMLDVYNLALISLLLFPCLVMALIDAVMIRQGGVVTVCYRLKTLSK